MTSEPRFHFGEDIQNIIQQAKVVRTDTKSITEKEEPYARSRFTEGWEAVNVGISVVCRQKGILLATVYLISCLGVLHG